MLCIFNHFVVVLIAPSPLERAGVRSNQNACGLQSMALAIYKLKPWRRLKDGGGPLRLKLEDSIQKLEASFYSITCNYPCET